MKKVLLLCLMISNICFASFYKCYKDMKIEDCTNKLIELSQMYEIKSYKIIPSEFIKGVLLDDSGKILTYNMIIELEEK